VTIHSPRFLPTRGSLRPIQAAVLALCACTAAQALELETGVSGLTARWDNTVKYSAGYRLKDADPTLASDANQGDGDTNFAKKGLISNRLDWLTELETSYDGFGARLSGAAWYDTVYNQKNKNATGGGFLPPTGLVNSTQVSSDDEFTPYTKNVHGGKAELLDWFVSGKFNADGHAGTVRLGQHTVLWGESLFFGDNAIAGAMSSVDIAKAASVPNLRFQEILRPVPQISTQLQLSQDLSLYSFYQLRWKENRMPGSGSYFSPVDFATGGNLLFVGPGQAVLRQNTHEGKNNGQGGLSLRYRGDDMDFGLYAVRFNSKSLSSITMLSPTGPVGYYDNVHNGIRAFGASINQSVGLFNFAAETSIRLNQDLQSPNAYDVGQGAQYAVGKTYHLNLSAFGTNMGRSPVWSDATLMAELAYNRVLSVQKGADTLSGGQPVFFPGSVCQPNNTRDSYRLQALLEPVYYQVAPGLDLRVPMGLSYSPKGSRSAFGSLTAEDGGSMNIGVQGTYLDTWRGGLTYTHFYGKAATTFSTISAGGTQAFNYGQFFRDRDYVSLVATRTF